MALIGPAEECRDSASITEYPGLDAFAHMLRTPTAGPRDATGKRPCRSHCCQECGR